MFLEKTIQLNNQMDELNKLFTLTEELQQELNLPMDVVFNVNLALEEALTNVIQYAYPDKQGQIDLTVQGTDDALKFTIHDEGVPFNPLEDAPEADTTSDASIREIGGLGVYLFRQLMDEVTYQRVENANYLCLTKKIK